MCCSLDTVPYIDVHQIYICPQLLRCYHYDCVHKTPVQACVTHDIDTPSVLHAMLLLSSCLTVSVCLSAGLPACLLALCLLS